MMVASAREGVTASRARIKAKIPARITAAASRTCDFDQEIVTLHHAVGDLLGRLVPVGEIGDVDGIRDQEDHPR